MPRIVLATIGSLGDLHPFVAIGLALRARGAEAVLAVPEDHVARVRAAGLEAHAIMPSFQEVGRAIGLPDEEIVRRVIADTDFMFRRIILPWTGDGVERLLRIAAGADAVMGSAVAPAAAIAAERLRLPFVRVVLQPMIWWNPDDPPRAPALRALAPRPAGRITRSWNRTLLAAVRWELRRRYGPALDRVRLANGLEPAGGAPLIDPGSWIAGEIGTYSPLLGGAPRRARLTGFPWWDRDEDASAALDDELERFLNDGPPPLVVSLGSFIPYSATDLYAQAAEAAQALGLRAVLLAGEASVAPQPGVLVRRYAPHSLLFPRAAAVVHHGGIGTTGQALRSGRPQLVAPFMGDQFDNAARVARLGIGSSVRHERFRRDAPRLLRRLLDEPGYVDAARSAGATIAAEDGAGAAADAVLATLSGSDR